eukprot:CAMPEP_0185570060 /NCGR_PEP_ID=MMETSP0434-20130131/2503_1 /TAXON_ID=626734 ORGANISM="Favella taraikaensis, Strain Fe Narragansett Bay" /NCGR_SAMPLE_ID=MMETSP0434 /ASSEMBLY_ACC=CAM_ASM_000379 /LENGTH=108 /DNA_ID=CAMNT_0028185071 /DNA_START=13 /DNA_END=339 /DNA_ORIENTATION=-
MREVETGDVHAGVEHFDKHIGVPAGRAEGTDDLGLALTEIDLLEDVLEANAARVGAASVCVYHSILTVVSKVCSFVGLCTRTCSSLKLLLLNYKSKSQRRTHLTLNKF